MEKSPKKRKGTFSKIDFQSKIGIEGSFGTFLPLKIGHFRRPSKTVFRQETDGILEVPSIQEE